jgi:hypothetical protein
MGHRGRHRRSSQRRRAEDFFSGPVKTFPKVDAALIIAVQRGHSLTIDSGWRQVADTALAFLKRFV